MKFVSLQLYREEEDRESDGRDEFEGQRLCVFRVFFVALLIIGCERAAAGAGERSETREQAKEGGGEGRSEANLPILESSSSCSSLSLASFAILAALSRTAFGTI